MEQWEQLVGKRTERRGAAATFYDFLTAPRTITVDAPVTVGTMAFYGTNQYTIAGPNAVTMQASSGSPAITVMIGGHAISAPLVLTGITTVTVTNPGDTLTISGPVGGAGALTLGGSGTLVLGGSNTYSGGTSVASGALVLANSAAPAAEHVGH